LDYDFSHIIRCQRLTARQSYLGSVLCGDLRSEIAIQHVTRHNTRIHNISSTAFQLSISQKALQTLPEDGNVMPKHVGATIRN
jgi:hypothetical protein